MSCHRPAHHFAAERVKHHRQIQKAGPGRNIGDVGNPQPVRTRRAEITFDQVWRGPRGAIPGRGGDPLAAAHPINARRLHQPRDPLAPELHSRRRQLGVNARCAVGPARPFMDRLDAQAQLRIAARPRRLRPFTPPMVAAGGDSQDPAHGGNPIGGLIRAHELERRDGTEPVSVANQAAAFDNISRSSRNTRFSPLSRVSSSRSVLVSPSLRSPASSCACLTHCPIVASDGSNSRANSFSGRPARASSTIRRRYSAGYGVWVFGIVLLPAFPPQTHSTKPGQLHPALVAPYRKGSKHDPNDAAAACEAVGRGNMRFVAIKSVAQQDLLALHRLRTLLVRQSNAWSNQLRALLYERGVVVAKGAAALKRMLAQLPQDNPELSGELCTLLVTTGQWWQQAQARVAQLDAQLKRKCAEDERCRRLEEITGVGPLTATALVATVGNAAEFKSGRELSAYLGLVPRQHSTGGKTVLLGISKHGN